MKTAFALFAQYDGKAVIPVEDVCRDYFAPLKVEEFLRKTMSGEIKLPVVRMYSSQKAAKGIATEDLANYLDQQIAAARKDALALAG